MGKKKAVWSKPFEYHDEGSWDIFMIGWYKNSKSKRKRRMMVGGKR